MKYLKSIIVIVFLFGYLSIYSQTDSASPLQTDWETISLGKLQKKPRFKEPMISVKYICEDGQSFFNLSLKYMFTDAVFDEAVPVEYYKNDKIEFNTDKGKYELHAVRYSKARRMNSVAQKTAEIRVLFAGDLSFLKDNIVKNFTVHYAQGYQNVDLNFDEASHLRDSYNRFIAILPKPKQVAEQKSLPIVIQQEVQDTTRLHHNSLDDIRKKARDFRR